ncbi:MAG TPA: FtsX-like permease family protein, partial [Acidimicrobiales bacterium]|nr:FtsX-like permease family protein [Acidimicrobiales bacterium]
RSLAADESGAFLGGNYDKLDFHGPTPTVHVVGVIRTWLDLKHASFASNYFFATPAFYEAYKDQIFRYTEPELGVVLDHPADAARFVASARAMVEQQYPGSAQLFNASPTKPGLTSIRDATRVQALSLGLVAIAAAIAGLVAIALMVARSVSASSSDFPALRAMGFTRPGRAGLVATTMLPGAVAGTLLALLGATLASPLFPTAVARQTAPPPAIRFDAVALLLGAAVLLAVVLGSAAAGAYRWRPVPVVQTGLYVGPLDRVATVLPPSPRVGVRWALPRRDALAGRGGTAIVGAIVGVCALAAALTYAAGLNHLVTTPAAYGWTFDVDNGGGTDVNATMKMRDTLLQYPGVGDVGLARICGSAHIGSATADVYGFESVRGPFGPTVLSGREPVAEDEILLATKTARQIHKGVGSSVQLLLGPGAPPATLRVVGIGLLPSIESDQLAQGAAMTRAGLEGIPGDNADLQKVFNDNTHVDALVRLAPGVNHKRTLARLQQDGLVSYLATPPGDVRNLDLVRSYPLWLAGFLAAVGLFTVVNALVVSARRRSQQVGILRALGLTRSQIVGAVSSQGAAMCLIGALVGIPLGIALGRWTWAASARQLGVSEAMGAPLAVLFVVIAAGLGLLLLLGATAGFFAARATPARALRTP